MNTILIIEKVQARLISQLQQSLRGIILAIISSLSFNMKSGACSGVVLLFVETNTF